MYSRFSHSRNHPHSFAVGGFGLIELMVSISIVLLVTALVMSKHGSFNSSVLLRSQAYEIALAAREVQLNAVSASSANGDFRSLLGLHFDTANNDEYRIFKDADNDGFFDANEIFGRQSIIDSRFEIRAIRPIGDTLTGTALSVVFERPNFDARFFDSSGELSASSVEIDVARRGVSGTGPDVVRTLEVTATGQIAVQ
jgi:type II secretory pathway pseudopilin PulG